MVRSFLFISSHITDSNVELGHSTRACTQEAFENTDRTQVKCVNCNEVGHRARDCPVPRVDRFACRNCKYVSPNSTYPNYEFQFVLTSR